jgi:hypothetical protein
MPSAGGATRLSRIRAKRNSRRCRTLACPEATYSIENYIVTSHTFERALDAYIRIRDVSVPIEPLLRQFERELKNFQRQIMPLMGWILVVRRYGLKPNLNNIDLHKIFYFTDDFELKFGPRKRIDYLDSSCGVASNPVIVRQIRRTTNELLRLPPKRVIRGKFELWFFVEFFKRAFRQIQLVAEEAGGSAKLHLSLEHNNAIEALAEKVQMPSSLETFLRLHISLPLRASHEGPKNGLLNRAIDFISHLFAR